MKDVNDSGEHQELAQHHRTLAAHEPDGRLRLLYTELAEKHAALAAQLAISNRR